MKNRICIFCYYDPHSGVAGDVLVYIQALKKLCSRMLIVSNSHLDEEAEARLKETGCEVFGREDGGYDADAYRFGLCQIGFKNLQAFDEVILANDSVFGPLYPLKEMFDAMEARDLDFWGVTAYPGAENRFEICPDGIIPPHIQTYFMVFSKRLIGTSVFAEFFLSLPEHIARKQAIADFEYKLTEHFANLGFSWGVYASLENDDTEFPDQTIFRPFELIRNFRMPFVKRKVFSTNILTASHGEDAPMILDWISRHTLYDPDMILARLIRSCHAYDFVKALGLIYIGSSNSTQSQSVDARTCLIMHLYYPDLLDQAVEVAKRFPHNSDIRIFTDTEEKAVSIRSAFSEWQQRTQIQIIPNRGRSESALLLNNHDLAEHYDLCCFYKEKKTAYYSQATITQSWDKRLRYNLFHDAAYVVNVISIFENHPRLGLLSPPPPYAGRLYRVLGNEWTMNYSNTDKLAKALGLSVPMSPDKPPIAPYGGVFWFRPKALDKLLQYYNSCEQFPEEPLESDGTLLHAIERIYPYVCQDAGYYPAWLLNETYVGIEIMNHIHFHRAQTHLANRLGRREGSYTEIPGLVASHEAQAVSSAEKNLREEYEARIAALYKQYDISLFAHAKRAIKRRSSDILKRFGKHTD